LGIKNLLVGNEIIRLLMRWIEGVELIDDVLLKKFQLFSKRLKSLLAVLND